MKEVQLFKRFTTYRWKFFNDHDRGSDNILLYRCLFCVGRRLSQNIMSFLPRQHIWASYPRFDGSIQICKAPELPYTVYVRQAAH